MLGTGGFFRRYGPLSQSDKREAVALLFQYLQSHPALHKDSFVGRVVFIAALNIPPQRAGNLLVESQSGSHTQRVAGIPESGKGPFVGSGLLDGIGDGRGLGKNLDEIQRGLHPAHDGPIIIPGVGFLFPFKDDIDRIRSVDYLRVFNRNIDRFLFPFLDIDGVVIDYGVTNHNRVGLEGGKRVGVTALVAVPFAYEIEHKGTGHQSDTD